MKSKDITFLLILAALCALIFISKDAYPMYISLNTAHPYLLAFAKFAVLSTLGESMGLRIKTGNYTQPNYGLLPRFIIWGLFGVWIAIAMKTFAVGTPFMAKTFGIENKIAVAFLISVMMNGCFAPVFMTLHKITDAHILENGGKLRALITPINMSKQLTNINWGVQWGFVFKKTVTLFWIPAHTITFLLPSEFQVLFAALLSVALGLFLSVGAVISRK